DDDSAFNADGAVGTVPSWQYFVFRFLLCWTYFMAGVSKISEAWLSGYITETMLHNWDFPFVEVLVPNHMTLLQLAQLLAWGGLLLDLVGGPLLLAFVTAGKNLATYACLSMFIPFHLTNLSWLFQSIQFFPLNMLSSTLLLLPAKTENGFNRTGVSWRALLALLIVLGQAAFSTRRFFLLGSASLWEINEITEVTAIHHEFSWRMKSKAIRDSIPNPLLKDKQLKLGYFAASNWNTGARNILNTYTMMPRGTTPHRNLIVQFARRKMAHGGTAEAAYQLSSNHWLSVCGRPFQLVLDSRFDILDSKEQTWPPPLMPFDLPLDWRSLLEEDLQAWAPYNNEYFVVSRDLGVVANPLLHLNDEVQPLMIRCLVDARLTVLLKGIGPVNCAGPDGFVELKAGKRWEIFGHGLWSLVWHIKWVESNAAGYSEVSALLMVLVLPHALPSSTLPSTTFLGEKQAHHYLAGHVSPNAHHAAAHHGHAALKHHGASRHPAKGSKETPGKWKCTCPVFKGPGYEVDDGTAQLNAL
ncbi:hypothetical protein FOZ63_005304, partial [Perkinsus olseni]